MILLVSLGFGSMAQVKPFRFGIQVSPNLGWLSPGTDGYTNEGARLGFNWGFMADITLADNYFVKTGFSVDYLNGKLSYPTLYTPPDFTGSPIEGTLTRKYNLRYLELPASIKMRTNKFGNTAFFGDIGFSFQFNLKSVAKDSFDPDSSDNIYTSDETISDEITFFRSGLILGAGFEYFIDESTSIVTELSFNNGFNNILKGNNALNTDLKQQANLNYFQLMVGVMF